MQLGKYPRAKLAQLPTPLEFMPRLTKALGGPKLWVKRDDCTGLATGGNKTRKLEFLLGEALAQGAETLITLGAVQSNHVRQTAAAAAKYGLKCEIVLEKRLSQTNEAYERNGNILLDKMLGANLRYVPGGTAMTGGRSVGGEIRGGRRPYVIPSGSSNPVGALGYIDARRRSCARAARWLRRRHRRRRHRQRGTQAGRRRLRGGAGGVDVLGFGASPVSAGRGRVQAGRTHGRLRRAEASVARERDVWRLCRRGLRRADHSTTPSAIDQALKVCCSIRLLGQGHGGADRSGRRAVACPNVVHPHRRPGRCSPTSRCRRPR